MRRRRHRTTAIRFPNGDGSDHKRPQTTEGSANRTAAAVGGFAIDFVDKLQEGNCIELVKEEFMKLKQVDCEVFADIMMAVLDIPDTDVARKDLRQLFTFADSRKVGVITWDDFTTYCVDAEILGKINRELADNLVRWELQKEVVSLASHRPWKIKPMNSSARKFLIVDASSAIFSVNEKLEAHKVAASLAGTIIDADFIPSEELFAMVTAASELIIVDPVTSNSETVRVDNSLQVLHWNAVAGVLCSGDRNGNVACWIAERSPTDRVRPAVLARQWHFGFAAVVVLTSHRASGLIVAGFTDGVVRVIHPLSGRVERHFCVGLGLNAVSVSEHQNSILCGALSPVPQLWALTACEDSKPFEMHDRRMPHTGPIVSVLCFPGTAQAATLDFSGVLKIWDLRTFSRLQTFQCRMRENKVCWTSMALSGDGKMVIFCDRKNVSYLYQLDEMEQHALKGAINSVCFAPLTERLMSMNVNSMRLWSGQSGELVAEVPLEQDEVTCASSDTDGRRVFVGTVSGAVWIFNTSTAGVIMRFPYAHRSPVVSIAFLDHANVAVSCAADGSGSILKPPTLAVQSDALFSRVQPAFRLMTGRLCLYVGAPCFHMLVADASMNIHVHDARAIASTMNLLNVYSVRFGPRVERLTHADRAVRDVVGRDGAAHVCVAAVALPKSHAAIIADLTSMALILLPPHGRQTLGRVLRWTLDATRDDAHIVGMVAVQHEAGLLVADDSGRVTYFRVRETLDRFDPKLRSGPSSSPISKSASTTAFGDSQTLRDLANVVVVSPSDAPTALWRVIVGPSISAFTCSEALGLVGIGFVDGSTEVRRTAPTSGDFVRLWVSGSARHFVLTQGQVEEEGPSEVDVVSAEPSGRIETGRRSSLLFAGPSDAAVGTSTSARSSPVGMPRTSRSFAQMRGAVSAAASGVVPPIGAVGTSPSFGWSPSLCNEESLAMPSGAFPVSPSSRLRQAARSRNIGNKRPDAGEVDKDWVRQQLETLGTGTNDGTEEATTFNPRSVARILFVTPRLKIPCVSEPDPFAECVQVIDEGAAQEISGVRQARRAAEDSLRNLHTADLRQTRAERNFVSAYVPKYVGIRPFVTTVSDPLPSTSPPPQPIQRYGHATLLRPISREQATPSAVAPSELLGPVRATSTPLTSTHNLARPVTRGSHQADEAARRTVRGSGPSELPIWIRLGI